MNSKEIILKYTSFSLVLLISLVSFSNALYPQISPKTFFLYGVIEALFLLWVYFLATNNTYRIQRKTLMYFLPAGVFILWLTVAGIAAPNPHLAFWSSLARGVGLLTFYHTFIFSLIVTSLIQKHGVGYRNKLLKYFIIGATAGAITIWLGPNGFNLPVKILQTGGEGGTMGNSSLAAIYMIFAAAFAWFLIVSKEISSRAKKIFGLCIALIVFSPILINVFGFFNGTSVLGVARASLLSLFVFICSFFILYAVFSSKKNIRNMGIFFAIIGLSVFAFAWHGLVSPETKLHKSFVQQAGVNRFIFWDIASEARSQHPLLGYGPENYSIVFQKYFNPNILEVNNAQEGWADRAHNIYYDISASGGYPALLLYILFIASLFYGIYHMYVRGRINQSQCAILMSAVVTYLFQLLFTFDSNLSLLALFMLLGIIFADVPVRLQDKADLVIKDKNHKNILFGVLVVLYLVLVSIFAVLPFRKAIQYQATFSQSFGSQVPEYGSLLEGAGVGSDWDAGDASYQVYQYLAVHAVAIKNDPTHLPRVTKNLQALVDYLYQLQEVNTTDLRLYLSTVYLENTITFITGRAITPELSQKILNSLNKAAVLSPTNPQVYWTIAQVKVWAGDFPGAEKAYRDAVFVAPQLSTSYITFMKYAQVIGNQKLFNEIANQAQSNIPNFKYN